METDSCCADTAPGASVLVLPLIGFLPADDDRMLATIRAVERGLVRNDLVYRWEGDTNGLVLCTYWLVVCLALAGHVGRATQRFDRVTSSYRATALAWRRTTPN